MLAARPRVKSSDGDEAYRRSDAPAFRASMERMKRFKAAVMGGSGYGGAELIRRLLLHPDVELVRVASVDFVGELLSAAHPSLEGATNLRFENLPAEKVSEGVDVVLR